MRILNLTLQVPWSDLKPGMSFFIPCLDTTPVIEFLVAEGARHKYKMLAKQVIEKNMYGLRCWRVE